MSEYEDEINLKKRKRGRPEMSKQEKQESYERKIEYQKKRSKYIRHLYPQKALTSNTKARERAQNKRWSQFHNLNNHLKFCIYNDLQIPDFLKNIKEPKTYKPKKHSVKTEKCEIPNCEMCIEAKNFLKIK